MNLFYVRNQLLPNDIMNESYSILLHFSRSVLKESYWSLILYPRKLKTHRSTKYLSEWPDYRLVWNKHIAILAHDWNDTSLLELNPSRKKIYFAYPIWQNGWENQSQSKSKSWFHQSTRKKSKLMLEKLTVKKSEEKFLDLTKYNIEFISQHYKISWPSECNNQFLYSIMVFKSFIFYL